MLYSKSKSQHIFGFEIFCKVLSSRQIIIVSSNPKLSFSLILVFFKTIYLKLLLLLNMFEIPLTF